MNKENQAVTAKMITGAETGGQVYGAGRWDDVKVPKIGLEVTLTLGAYQFYGEEGRELLKMVYMADPSQFSIYLHSCLGMNWVTNQWVPPYEIRKQIANIISSPIGKAKQVELFCQIQLPAYIKRAEEFCVFDDKAQMMWVEIEHVGGLKAAKRIFTRCGGDYSLDKIMWALKCDQDDHSSENQAGDRLYWSRHVFCRNCIEKYAVDSDSFDGVYVEVSD